MTDDWLVEVVLQLILKEFHVDYVKLEQGSDDCFLCGNPLDEQKRMAMLVDISERIAQAIRESLKERLCDKCKERIL